MNDSVHPFKTRPHWTLLALSVPVLVSMIAEPLTALVDTAFISSLGVNPLAALGVGTTALSSLFWIFNFLGVGTQTEVAQVFGKGKVEQAKKIASLALALALGFGLFLILVISPISNWLAELLGASGEVQELSVTYMQIRLYGAPAVLLLMVAFGALRGLQDMRSPLWIALGVNVLNLLLDWALIFGPGPFPELGVAGSALASTISQWLGALAGILITARKIGLSTEFTLRDAQKLLKVGGDLFIRTALLNIFLAYTTRVANSISPDAGAAHQVIRQVYVFTALALDAFASTVQSLVGYFVGQDSVDWAKQVVRVGMAWSLGTGIALGALMWWGRQPLIDLMVPIASINVFLPAWAISALSQPLNSLAFLTDGAHWGTGDYKFLRNAMLAATLIGVAGIWLVVEQGKLQTLYWVWIVTAVWVLVRAGFGVLRVWPGIGNSIFRSAA
ncbi:MAG: MATE family efflux transporter [Anaerolineales bacterium]